MTPTDILQWLTQHPQLAITILTALAGSGQAARHYRRTGKIPLSTLPWRAFRRLAYNARKRFFTVPRPRKREFIVDSTLDDVRNRLASESYQPAWILSYKYHGEDLNTRRYYHDPDREYPHRQIHIRGFQLQNENAIALIAHEEPAPEYHPRVHLQDSDMADATRWLQAQWDSPALDPRTYEPPQ